MHFSGPEAVPFFSSLRGRRPGTPLSGRALPGSTTLNSLERWHVAWPRPHDHGESPRELVIDPSARLDPMVVADCTRGPIVIDRDAVVTAFSRLEGPCYIGPGTHVLGAKIRAGTTIGPQCRVGGEVEASIMHGFG